MPRKLLFIFLVSLLISSGSWCWSFQRLERGEHQWLEFHLGIRGQAASREDGAPDGKSDSLDFDLSAIQFYALAQVHRYLKLEFNVGSFNESDLELIDAVLKFEYSDILNVWAGRFLQPNDRVNLSGPFFSNTWDFIPIAHRYPSRAFGRDDGLVFWGKAKNGFSYYTGVFEGNGAFPNSRDKPLFSGRGSYSFWDPEPGPPYVTNSSYLGSVDVFTIGLALMQQDDFAGNSFVGTGDFLGWNLDLLLEKKLASRAVFTLEGAYYHYDVDRALSGLEGDGFYLTLGWLFPKQLWLGQLRPVVQYQEFSPLAGGDQEKWEVGCHYLIKGHFAKAVALYTRETFASLERDSVVLGVQFWY